MKKMTQRPGRLLAAMLTLVLTLSLFATPALAANTPAPGGTVPLDKYLVMDKDATVPTVAFKYTIAAGQAVTSTTPGTQSILAGVDADQITIADTAFTPTTTKHEAIQGDDTPAGFTVGTHAYAKVSTNIVMTGVSFTKPGIYRYTITEQPKNLDVPANVPSIEHDGTTTRVLDVAVGYANDTDREASKLSVIRVVLHRTINDTATGNPLVYNDKDKGFTNTYETGDLTLSKTVTGNQGDRDLYFKFTVNIDGTGVAGSFKVTDKDGNNPSTSLTTGTASATTAAATATVGDNIFWLKTGEKIIIHGLPNGATYSIVEDRGNCGDYTTTIEGSDTENEAAFTAGGNIATGASDDVAYTNHREGTVPTGILLDIAPYALIVAFAGIALIMLFGRKRKASHR